MKKLTKILSIVMVIMMLAMAVSPIIFAASQQAAVTHIDADQITPIYGKSGGKIKDIGQKILGVLTNLGIVISVIVIAGLGIKYITGSAEEKAEYKKSFVPLLVGMVLLLGASAIAKFLIDTIS